jgi:hypothetical protein
MNLAFCIGWVVLISSWITSWVIKDKHKGNTIALILSSLATGIFIGSVIQQYLS